ncbi:MerR family transcriptional regulator [Actinoplanes sichuanensis]|uniref:MerR family transcriptional regulator n=1 Tax=Actinoplanes sichuanensis TaxID=512349 RepID=A0ABW4A5A6_9ACTN|nr:MerR family transcriptional regulator [Actinoplanes sichuanensis]BEL10466.1 MerR family transcriptional regulator [Actinoplanes sichuanensis]
MANDGLSAGAAARRLGVAVTTLRTWHQRYGLGPSRHEPGHHRRYTVEDMVRLQVMQRLTAQGVAPAEAAAWARRSPDPAAPEPNPDSPASFAGAVAPADSDEPVLRAAAAAARESILSLVESGALIPDVRPGDGRAGGGQTIALGPRADPAARGLARAAMRLDAPSMRYILESAVTHRGVISAWNDVMMPVLIGIGERYEATERFVEVEHLLSRSVTEALSIVPRPARDLDPRVLLAAADEEQHTLPLEALAAALAENGVPSRLLGARVPSRALLDAVDRTGPAVVVLWSQLPGTGDVTQLEHLLSLPHPPLVVAAAGPGWPIADLPPLVTPLSGLAEAVRVASAANA